MSTATLQRRKKGSLPFDTSFQTKLVRTIFQHPEFASSIHAEFDPGALDTKLLRWALGRIFWYHREYGAAPTTTVMVNEAKKAIRLGKIANNEVAAYAKFIERLSAPTPDRTYIEDQVYDFMEATNTRRLMLDAISAYEKGDIGEVKEIWRKGVDRQTNRSSGLGINLGDKAALEQRIARRKSPVARGIPTGCRLDTLSKYEGLGRKQIGVFIGPPGRGKTAVLVDLGGEAARFGFKVLHVTCELDEDDIVDRYDAHFTQIDMNVMAKKPKTIREKYESGLSKIANNVHVKFFPTGSLTVPMLDGYIKQLERTGFYPDLLVIDYVDLMKPTGRFEVGDEYAAQGAVCRELRGLAGRRNIAVWTATQANRGSLDKEVIGIQDVADSFQKMMVCDMVVTICQTPEEQQAKKVRFFMAKNRNGFAGVEIYIRVDYTRCRVHDLDEKPPTRSNVGKKFDGKLGVKLGNKVTPITKSKKAVAPTPKYKKAA